MNPPALETFEDLKLVFQTQWSEGVLFLAGLTVLAALLLSLWSYRRHRLAVAVLLGLLRALAIAAVALMVLQPAMQLRSITRRPNHVALLADMSSSMAIRENPDLLPRLERLRKIVKRSRGRIDNWRRKRLVSGYGFGEQLRTIPVSQLAQGEPPDRAAADSATRIRAALVQLREQHRGNDLAGVVLLSDGNDNGRFGETDRLSGPAKTFLRGLGVPVHTVWVGDPQLRDLSIAAIYADDFAFVRNAVKVEADLLASGLPTREVIATLREGERVLAQRKLQLRSDKQKYRVRFEFVPQRVGKYVYTISVPDHAGEAVAENNARSFVVKVIRDRIRVLQICGRPSWDERFLRQLLKRDPNVDLLSFFILRTLSSVAAEQPGELSLIPFPTEELFERELGSFDLVILQNFNFAPYGIGVYLPHLRRYVEQGGGLAMIGGDLSFTSGGYSRTEVARVLPVRLLAPNPDPNQLVSTTDFRPRLTKRGVVHPILQLGRSKKETKRLLSSLPLLAGVNRVAGAARKAVVLATHPQLKGQDNKPMPVLAVREVGKGRTMAFTSDSSWHWAFKAIGSGGTRQGYDRFWRNAIRWLIRDPELKSLRVIAQRSAIQLGDATTIVVQAYNPDYTPAREVAVSYEITPVDGGSAGVARSGRTDKAGELRIEHRPKKVGALRVRASAVLGGRRTTEEELLLVEPSGPEGRDPRALSALLEQIAETTGGRYLGQVARLPELKWLPPKVVRVNWRRDFELWSRWWWLLGAVTLLSLEWMVRRRFGHF